MQVLLSRYTSRQVIIQVCFKIRQVIIHVCFKIKKTIIFNGLPFSLQDLLFLFFFCNAMGVYIKFIAIFFVSIPLLHIFVVSNPLLQLLSTQEQWKLIKGIY